MSPTTAFIVKNSKKLGLIFPIFEESPNYKARPKNSFERPRMAWVFETGEYAVQDGEACNGPIQVTSSLPSSAIPFPSKGEIWESTSPVPKFYHPERDIINEVEEVTG